MTDIHNGYYFITPIVGESNYTKALKKCYNDADAYKKGQSVFIDVELVLENHNRYDNQAVAVISPYRIIGYLSKNHAQLYRQDYNDNLTVRAKIYSRDGSIFGAWVDLPYDEYDKPTKTKNPNPSQNTVVGIPDYLDGNIRTSNKDKPQPPPKPWKEQTTSEKILVIIGLGIWLFIGWIIWKIITWIF